MDYIIADPYLTPKDEAQYFTEEVWPLAKVSLRAGLIKLVAEGRARAEGGGWAAA